MTQRTSGIKKFLLLSLSALLFLAKFIGDVVVSKLDIEMGMLTVLQVVLTAGAFVCLYLYIEKVWRRDRNVVRKMGFALVLTLVVGLAGLILYTISSTGFDIKNEYALPQGFESIVFANLYAVVFGTTALFVLLTVRDIIMSKRRKETKRNFRIFLLVFLGAIVVTLPYRPFESGPVISVSFTLLIFAILMNSFRLSWIVYLTKREKLIAMSFSFILFVLYIPIYVTSVGESSLIAQSLSYYSRQLATFISGTTLFAATYFGMTFVTTLFHLPTAEAFDRKNIEVLSLHNLGKLITRVFDFQELTDLVTRMTLEVCEAESAWLEVRDEEGPSRGMGRAAENPESSPVRTVSLQNIDIQDIGAIVGFDNGAIRRMVSETRRPVVIDQVAGDDRTKHVKIIAGKINSMAIVPLVSHDDVIGILYATKTMEFGFDREDADVLSAFADQVSIALENSRLIGKSLERERLMRELLLAQEMQRKLLPQELPSLPQVEIEALSTPAFEVGGDYYDFTMLDDEHLGVIVGDVSGKGVSAALFMAEMKGIFLSLSRRHTSPRDFLSEAHSSLLGTMDRRTFISLIYAIVDLRTGVMRVARAGHCPMIFRSGGMTRFVKPTGLGVGMGSKEFFSRTITEDEIRMSSGDVAVFYTDGVTEARQENGEEFGYRKLEEIVARSGAGSALDIRDRIVLAVDTHLGHKPPDDDLTIVVLKWLSEHTHP
ncbi:MAG TPA: GAF domain-containing SpoIIE family protein phosphatase [Bacteroidota bacterium]|nr:GAF domain-containing SpoIIE family protein phosphatase [Bacteroidota bacterium]